MVISGKRLRRIREDMGLSSLELAQMSSISPSYLSMLESGQRSPSPRVAGRIANALGIAIADLRNEHEAFSIDL